MKSKAVLLTGTVGTGKSAVAADLVELLKERGVPAAAIDLDWLCWAYVERSEWERLMTDNLRALVRNFASVGIDRFVLARAITASSQIDVVRDAFDDVELVVARLVTPPHVAEARIRNRDTGAVLEDHLVQTKEIDRALDEITVEDFRVVNDDRDIRTVSEELLEKLDW